MTKKLIKKKKDVVDKISYLILNKIFIEIKLNFYLNYNINLNKVIIPKFYLNF